MKHNIKSFLYFAILFSLLFGCSKEEIPDDPIDDEGEIYFPPVNSDEWETVSPEALSWNVAHIEELFGFLSDNGTRAFIVLKDGKIVLEEYWGRNMLNTAPFDAETNWYWASAAKTIIAVLTGIAQQENDLTLDDKTSDYLGTGWTSMDLNKEDLITIRHQLTMTTGLDYTVDDQNCADPACLNYKADAGTQWYYHNAPYLLMKDVISNATGTDYKTYIHEKLETPTGMNGQWIGGIEGLYWSAPRDMARFGLMILNKGVWANTPIITDATYFDEMTNTSQELNPSYGYFWWLNGKSSIIVPGLPISINTEMASNAPDDLIAGAGANGQFVDVVPGENLVVIRMGDAPDASALSVEFHNEMWAKLNQVINH